MHPNRSPRARHLVNVVGASLKALLHCLQENWRQWCATHAISPGHHLESHPMAMVVVRECCLEAPGPDAMPPTFLGFGVPMCHSTL